MRAALCAIAFTVMCAADVANARPARTGELRADPAGIIDLPADFNYKVVARAGDEMSDGRRVPAFPDGMGAFRGSGGTTIVVCNHECIYSKDGPFGSGDQMRARIDTPYVYDAGDGTLPPAGSTTTFIWDTRAQSLVRHFLSLTGTMFNCSGGTTPWGTWLTCEEKTYRTGWTGEGGAPRAARDHGYVFEVPAIDQPLLADVVPLVGLGRFAHESLYYDERTGIIYQTEDLEDGLFYRFVPSRKGSLETGRLQVLALHDGIRDSSNHGGTAPLIRAGERLRVRWIDMDEVDSPKDDLRLRGYARGACRFSRGEGMCMLGRTVYFTCTSGGALARGQVWRYVPSQDEGRPGEKRLPGTLELFYEVTDTTLMADPDNITATPSDELLLCEDPERGGLSRMVLIDARRRLSTFARSRLPGELTGAVFSPDGSTLFVNMQKAGIMLAITGPWKQ